MPDLSLVTTDLSLQFVVAGRIIASGELPASVTTLRIPTPSTSDFVPETTKSSSGPSPGSCSLTV